MSIPAKGSTRMRLRLLMSSALAGAAAMVHAPIFGQNILPQVAVGGDGGATIAANMAGDQLGVNLNDASRVIDYDSFNVGAANAVNFTTADPVTQYSVLNRVIMANPSSILGAVNAQNNIAVWLVNPSGITFGSGATFSGGALVLSTAGIGNADFLDGNTGYTLTQGAVTGLATDSQIVLASGSTIGAPNGFVAVAQDVQARGAISTGAGTGSVALVAAADTVLDFTPGGPLAVNVTAGTTIGTAQVSVGSGAAITANAITLAGAAAAAPMANLLNIDTGATLTATASNGRVTLATASDVAAGVTIAGGVAAGAINTAGALSATGIGGRIGITSNATAVTNGPLTAAGSVAIAASQGLTVAGGVSAGGNYTLSGASVSLGDNAGGTAVSQLAGGAVDITATTGGILGFSGLTLASNRDGAGAESLVLDAAAGGINFAVGSSAIGGIDGDRSNIGIRLATATDSVTLDTVNGARLANADVARTIGTTLTSGPLTLGAVTLTQSLDATAAGSIAIGSVSITGASQNLSLTANGVGADIAFTGAASAPGAVSLTANDAISGTTLSGASIVASATNGTLGFATTTSTAGATSLTAGTSLTVDTVSSTGGGATLAANLIDADSVTADSNVQFNASDDVEVNSATSNGGDVLISAGGDVTGRAGAGSRIAISANSPGGDISVIAAGAASLGALTAGQDLTVTAGSIDASPLITATPGALRLTATASDITVGSVTGGTSALVASTSGNATVTGTITAQNGTATVNAANLASVAGASASGTPGDVVISGGSVLLSGAHSATGKIDVTASSGAINGVPGLALTSNSGGVADAGNSRFIALDAANGIDLTGSTINAGTARESLLGIRHTGATATQDLTLGTVNARTIVAATAGPARTFTAPLTGNDATFGDVTLTDAFALDISGALTALDIAITAGAANFMSDGVTTIDSLTSTGGGASLLSDVLLDAGSITADNNVSLSSTGDIEVDSATSNSGNLGVASSGNLTGRAGAGTRTTLSAAAATRNVSVTAGGTALLGPVTAGNDVTVTAGAIDASPSISATAGALSLTATASDITVASVSGGTSALVASTTGNATVTGTITAQNGTATVTAANLASVSGASASGTPGNLVISGGSVALSGIQAATGNVTVTATNAGGTVTGAAGLSLTSNSDMTGGGTTSVATNNGAINLATGSNLTSLGGVALNSGVTFNPGTADLSFDNVTADALTVGGTPANITSTGAILTSASLSLTTAGNLSLNTAETTAAASQITLAGGTGASANALRSVAGVTASADALTLGTVVAAQGFIDLDADVGNLGLASGQAFTGATVTKTGTTGALTITSLQAGTPAGAVSSDIDIDSSTDAALGNVTANVGNVTIDATGNVTGVGVGARANVAAANDVGSATLTATDKSVTINAGGQALLGTVVAGRDVAVTAGSLDVASATAASASLALQANGGQLTLGTGTVGTTAALTKTGATGDLRITGALIAGNEAGSNAAVTLQSDTDVVLPVYDSGTGAGAIRSLTGDVSVTADGSVTDLVGSATPADRGFGAISTTGSLSITSTDDVRADSLSAGTDLTINTAGSITDNGAGTTGTAVTGGGLFAQGTGRTVTVVAGTKAQLNTIAADAGVSVTAPSIAIGTIAINSGTVALNEAPATTADGANYYVGSLTSAGSLAFTLTGTPDVANATSPDFTLVPGFGGADLSAGGAISATVGRAAQIDDATSGTSTTIGANAISLVDGEAGTSLALTATGGGLYLGTGVAGTSATLDHQSAAAVADNELRIVTALTSGGPTTIMTATNARIASATAIGGTLNVRATGAITGLPGAATAGPLDAALGRALLATMGSGNDILADAGSIAQIGTASASGSLALRASEISADALSAGEDVAARSLGGATIGSASAGDDIELRTASDVALSTATTSGLGSDTRRADLDGVTLAFGAETLARSNAVIDAVWTVTLGTGATAATPEISIAGTLGVRSGGAVTASNLLAGEDIAIASGGDTVIGTATARDDIEIASAGGIQISTLAKTTGLVPVNDDRRLDLSLAAPAFAAETRTGSDLALLASGASGSIIVQRAEVAGDASVETQGASADVQVTDLLEAVGNAAIISTRDARLGTVRSTTGNIAATVTRDLTGVTAPSPFGAGTGLRVASLSDAGTTLIDAATGDVRIGSVSNNGGNVTVESGGSTTGLAIADVAAGPGAIFDAVLGSVTANAGGRAAIGSASAGQAIAIGATGISTGSATAGTTLTLTANDALSLDSGSGVGVTLTTSGGAAAAIDLTDANSAQDRLSDAFGSANFATVAPGGGDIAVAAALGAQLGTINARGAIGVTAGAIALSSANAGNTVTLTANNGGLYLGSGIAVGAATLNKLDTDANGLTDVNRDELRIRGTLTAGGAARIDSSTDARINAATGASITSTVTRDLTGLVPPGPSAIATGLRVASLTDSGTTLIDAATGDIRLGTVTNSGGNVTVESGDVTTASSGSVTGLVVADTGAGAGANLTATAGGIGVTVGGRVAIGNASATGGGIGVTGAQISAQSASATGSLNLAAADALSLDSGSAADATLTTSGGAAAAIGLTDAGAAQDKFTDALGAANISATAPGSAVTVSAGRAAQLGTVSATGAITADASALSLPTANAGGALTLTARQGGLYLGSATAGGAATLTKLDSDANGLADVNRDELRVRTALTAGGAARIDSSTDARINAATGTSITSTVTRDLTGLVPPGPSAIAQGVRIGSLTDGGITGTIETAGDIRIGTLSSANSDVTLRAGGSVTGLSTAADLPAGPGANLTATAASITATAGNRAALGTATAATSISVTAPQISVQNATAGTTLTLAAGNALSLDSGSANGTNLSATGGVPAAIALTSPTAIFDSAFGTANIAATGAGRSVTIVAGRAAQLGVVLANGSVSVDAAAASIDDTDASTGALDVLSRSGGLYIDEGDAALDATLTKQGGTLGAVNDELRITTALRSGGDIDVNSTTDARIAAAVAGRNLTVISTGSLTGLVPPGPSAIATGLRVGVLTDGGATAISATSGDVRIESIANSGGNIGISAGGSVTGLATAGDLAAGPGARLTATTGAIDATVGQRAAIESASAGGAISVGAAQLSAGSASAGTTLTLTAADALSLDSGNAVGATLLTSSGVAATVALTDAAAAQDKLSDAFGATNVSATAANSGVFVNAGGGAQLGTVGATATVSIDAAAISATTINAGGALSLTARQGGFYLGSATAVGAATLTKLDSDANGLADVNRDELRVRTALTAGGAARIDSSTDARINAATGTSITSTVTRDLTGLVPPGPSAIATGLRVGALADSGTTAISATSGDVRIGSLTNSGGNVGVTAGGSITGLATPGDLAAGPGAQFTATAGNITANAGQRAAIGTARATGAISVGAGQISTQSATAGGTLALTAADALSLDNGTAAGVTLSTSGGPAAAIARTDAGAAQDKLTDAFGSANIAATGSGRAVSVMAGQGAQLGTVAASGAVSVTAAAISAATANAGGTLSLNAGEGALYLGTGSAGGTATLVKADGDGDGLTAAQAGRDELRIRNALSAGGNVSITSATDNRIGGGTAGSGVSSASGSVAITSTVATTGLLSAATGASDQAYARGDVSAAAAGQDVTVTSGGLTQLGTVTAGRNATILAGNMTRNGAIDVSTIRATAGAVSLGARAVTPVAGAIVDGDIIVGTGSAGTTATLTNRDRGGTAGDITVATALTAGGNIAITSAANARLAGDDPARGITSTSGSITIDALQAVTGVSGQGRANLAAAGAGQDVTVLSGTIVQAGTVTAGRNIAVTAGTETLGNGAIDATSATASSGSLLLSARATNAGAGNVTLGTGTAGTTATLANTDRGGTTGNVTIGTSLTAGGLATIDAANQAAVNAVTSTGGNVLIRSNEIAVNGIVRSGAATGEVRVVNRVDTGTTQVNDTVLGTGGTEASQFVLSDAEIDRLQASRVVIQTLQSATQTQNVAIDTLSIAPATGTAQLDILADRNATIAINGAITAQDNPSAVPEMATRTLRIGGADIANPAVTGTDLANRILATTTATAGGRITLPAFNVDLRANRIVVGLQTLRDAVIGLTPEQVAIDFIANANSQLFDARGNFAPGAPNILTANSLTVRYRDFALFQNTALRGVSSGVVLGPETQSTMPPVRLRLVSSGAFPASNSFALFGRINGFIDQNASLLPPTVISFSELNGTGVRINQSSSRLNGCVLGAPDLGCLTTTNPAPQLQLFDESQILLLSSTLDAPVDFDPLIGANNESLFVDFGGFQVPTEDPDCIPGKDVECPPPEGSE